MHLLTLPIPEVKPLEDIERIIHMLLLFQLKSGISEFSNSQQQFDSCIG